jgi:hypothetical protein
MRKVIERLDTEKGAIKPLEGPSLNRSDKMPEDGRPKISRKGQKTLVPALPSILRKMINPGQDERPDIFK